MKLVKLADDHYVIVDDSEIKEGDMIYLLYGNTPSTKQGSIARCEFPDANNLGVLWKKITHSTQPLNKSLFFTDRVWGCERLSLGEVKELIGEVDVYSKKFEYLKKINEGIKHKSQDERIWIYGASDLGFTAGYNQAIEDNKEKKYTEEDMIEFAHFFFREEFNSTMQDCKSSEEIFQLWKEQQLKTIWDVEFDSQYKLKLI